jgi:putative NADH-flavin reductase
MKIAIIGASAGIGLETVKLALKNGHSVNALSRNNTLLAEHESLKKITGSALLAVDLKKAIAGTDAVIITVGTKKKKGTTLFSDLAKVLVKVISEMNYQGSVITVTGFGTGESESYLSFFMRLIIRLFLKDQYSDKTLMEEIIMGSGMKWEFVKPGMLTNGPFTSNNKVVSNLYKGVKASKISRVDVADYLVKEAENLRFLHHHVTFESGHNRL